MVFEFFKRNRLLLAFLAAHLFLSALCMLELDKQYFQNAKREIVRRDYFQTDRVGDQFKLLEGVIKVARQVLSYRELSVTVNAGKPTSPQEKAVAELAAHMREVVEGDNMFVGMDLYAVPGNEGSAASPSARRLVAHQSNLAKFRAANNFSNSLFLQDFSGFADVAVTDPVTGVQLGRLQTQYTTPARNERIVELTNKWRWRCVIILAFLATLGYLMARSLVLPLQRVQNMLVLSTPEKTRFVRNDRAPLEQLYNRMALDAVTARMHGLVREAVARNPGLTSWEAVSYAVAAFGEAMDAPLAACLEIAAEGPETPRASGRRLIRARLEGLADARDIPDETQLAETIEASMPLDGRRTSEFAIADAPALRQPGALLWLPDPDRTGISYLLALHLGSEGARALPAAQHHALGRLGEVVGAGLQSLSARNQLLVKERGRASISLSRNLGHDLTNIIATSKLEMMALERLLKDGNAPTDATRRAILIETLEGMLRSTRFMQETVNLYRAYAFLQHPVLEPADANALVADTLELFQMSTSSKLRVDRRLDPEAPRCLVDPRLIKLALFNLFANALDAIRKKDPDLRAPGWIRVGTGKSDDGGLAIMVADSGTGILDQDGRRLQGREIEQIFDLGYKTEKTEGRQGEGLGLNWVRTIVEDLHNGTIRAGNIDDGGACFTMIFPPLAKESEAPS